TCRRDDPRLRAIVMLGNPPDCLCVTMVRAEGLEPPHLSTTGPKPAASTNSATRADAVGGAAYNRREAFGKAGRRQPTAIEGVRAFEMQQQPEPSEPPTTPSPPAPRPQEPGQPSPVPPETPGQPPNIDVPSPPSPGTDPTPGPIAPVG